MKKRCQGISLAGFDKVIDDAGGRESFISKDPNYKSTWWMKYNFVKPQTANVDSPCRNQNAQVTCIQTCGIPLFEMLLRDETTRSYIADANVFISHSYRYNFLDVVDTIRRWENDSPPTNGTNYYYFDLFHNNQHDNGKIKFEILRDHFGSSLQSIGKTLLMLSLKDRLAALLRSWVVFEIAVTLKSEIDMQIVLILKDDLDIETELDMLIAVANAMDYLSDQREFSSKNEDYRSVFKVDVQNSEAEDPEDKKKIDEMITKELGGFSKVNAETTNKIIKYFLTRARAIHNNSKNYKLTLCLARYLRLYGSFKEAIKILDNFLKNNATTDSYKDKTELEIANLQSLLGSLQRQMGDTTEHTLSLLKKALATQEKYLDPRDDDILDTKSRLGVVLKELKYLDEASTVYEEVYNTRKEKFGDNHPETIFSNMNRAVFYKIQKRYKEHNDIVKDVFERRTIVLGENHPQTLFAKQMVGQIELRLGNFQGAKKTFNDTLEKQVDRMGKGHPEAIFTRFFLAETLSKIGDPLESLEQYKEAFDLAGQNDMNPTKIRNLSCFAIAKDTAVSVLSREDVSDELRSLALEMCDRLDKLEVMKEAMKEVKVEKEEVAEDDDDEVVE